MKFEFRKLILYKNRETNKWLGFVVALLIVVLTIWISNSLVQQLRIEERKKMESIVNAMELQSSGLEITNETQKLILKILEDNTSMPMILVDENGQFLFQRNLDKIENELEGDSLFLKSKIVDMGNAHPYISVKLPFGQQKIYYENSSLLSKLQYYPLVLIGIILLFVWFTIWYFRTLDAAQRSFLWAGMAKETAHQIGTPLSSLLGWIEILKMENIDQTSVAEMENDIKRLSQIAERFSKIGSLPELEEVNLSQTLELTYNYLKKRISRKISFIFEQPNEPVYIHCNEELISWVLENLVRNAVDAMQNRGKIKLVLQESRGKVYIYVRDNGPGIPNRLQNRIFEPGYTTKKRGWGLGLSLAKRIIHDYHKGKISVSYSEKGKGTEFKIELSNPPKLRDKKSDGV